MPRTIRTPDGVLHTFPDDATDDEIRLILAREARQLGGAPRGAAPRTPSAAGFAQHVGESGVRFGANVAGPALHPIETVRGVLEAARHPTLIGRLIADAIVKRYGSMDALLQTLYTDPVGAAADVSTLLTPAASAAKAAGSAKAAMIIGRTAATLNPLSLPAKAGNALGRTVYTAAINPSRAIRRSFPQAMAEGYERNILPTHGGLTKAEDALLRSATHTETRLAEAEGLGAPRITAQQITPAFDDAMARARLRVKGGLPNEVPDLRARQRATRRSLQFGQSLGRAQDIKQELQGVADAAFRAREKGALIKDLDALATKNVAQAYRKAIEVNAATVGIEDIAQSNAQTQALIGLTRALEAATEQPTRLSHLLATLEGVSQVAGGGVGAGAAGYAATRALTAKPVMAGASLLVGKTSRQLRHAQILRGLALMGALQGAEQ